MQILKVLHDVLENRLWPSRISVTKESTGAAKIKQDGAPAPVQSTEANPPAAAAPQPATKRRRMQPRRRLILISLGEHKCWETPSRSN